MTSQFSALETAFRAWSMPEIAAPMNFSTGDPLDLEASWGKGIPSLSKDPEKPLCSSSLPSSSYSSPTYAL
jgi:hypothetical protein